MLYWVRIGKIQDRMLGEGIGHRPSGSRQGGRKGSAAFCIGRSQGGALPLQYLADAVVGIAGGEGTEHLRSQPKLSQHVREILETEENLRPGFCRQDIRVRLPPSTYFVWVSPKSASVSSMELQVRMALRQMAWTW